VIAQYDMSMGTRGLPGMVRPTSYDFFNWLTHVRLLGATEITFRIEPMNQTKWPIAESLKRFRNYIWPGVALAGLPCRVANEGEARVGSVMMFHLLEDLAKTGKELPRLRTVKPPGKARYTVTIRETFHNPHKNSDRDLWLKFAERIGAHVFEDDTRAATDLHERVALCAGAEMNFGVTNGPLSLLYYTPYPFRMFCDPVATAKSFGGHQIKPGDQIPFFLPGQRFVWKRPTMDDLMREVEVVESV
jgi:hypothetical protein